MLKPDQRLLDHRNQQDQQLNLRDQWLLWLDMLVLELLHLTMGMDEMVALLVVVLVDMLLVRVLLGKLLAVMLDHNQQRNRLHHQWLLFNLLMLLLDQLLLGLDIDL